jgi:hypothetical protein
MLADDAFPEGSQGKNLSNQERPVPLQELPFPGLSKVLRDPGVAPGIVVRNANAARVDRKPNGYKDDGKDREGSRYDFPKTELHDTCRFLMT